MEVRWDPLVKSDYKRYSPEAMAKKAEKAKKSKEEITGPPALKGVPTDVLVEASHSLLERTANATSSNQDDCPSTDPLITPSGRFDKILPDEQLVPGLPLPEEHHKYNHLAPILRQQRFARMSAPYQ